MMLTISRMIMAPFIVRAVEMQQWGIATGLFVVAATTDMLDGFVARLWQQQSRLGSYIDPIADKYLMLSCYYSLVEARVLPLWFLIGICIKECILLAAGALMACMHALPMIPLWVGKGSMLMQVLFVFGIFLTHAWGFSYVLSTGFIALIFIGALLPLVHYAMSISWRFI